MLRHPAKLLLHHRQTLEAMAHGQLVGHAHAAVQLHRALADGPRSPAQSALLAALERALPAKQGA